MMTLQSHRRVTLLVQSATRNMEAGKRPRAPRRKYATKQQPKENKDVKGKEISTQEGIAMNDDESIIKALLNVKLQEKSEGKNEKESSSSKELEDEQKKARAEKKRLEKEEEQGLQLYDISTPRGSIASLIDEETISIPKLILCSTMEDAQENLKQVKSGTIISLDAEWKPTFISTPTSNKISLVQIATPKVIYLIQIGLIGSLPLELERIMIDSNIIKCGVGIRNDSIKMLKDWQCEIKGLLELSALTHLIDFEKLWKNRNSKMIALAKLSSIYLQRRLSKKAQLSNWSRSNLTDEQIQYAASDAYAGLEICYSLLKIGIDNKIHLEIDIQNEKGEKEGGESIIIKDEDDVLKNPIAQNLIAKAMYDTIKMKK